MEGKNRTIFVVLIAIVIVAAVFSSFGLNLFPKDTPEVALPAVTGDGGDGPGQTGEPADPDRYVRVSVTPETVQNVIRALSKPESYYRTVTVKTALGNGTMSDTVNQVWVDGGWTRVQSTWPNGVVEHTLVGDGKAYRWYGGDSSWLAWEAGSRDADLAQRSPTYEDVLELNVRAIVATGYEEREGMSCIFVETAENEAGNRERYWVAVDTGLLVSAETTRNGEIVMSMSSTAVERPVPPETSFALPDGTVLHQTGEGAAATEGGDAANTPPV